MLLAASIAAIVAIPFTVAISYPISYVSSRDPERPVHARGDLWWEHNAYPLSNTRKRQSTGAVALTNYGRDSTYYISAEFGTPPKPYNILLDTGTSDMWLASTECRKGCTSLVNLYTPVQNSATYNTSGTNPFNITIPYVNGSMQLQGIVATDTVSMVGFTVPNQTFGVITSIERASLPPNVTGVIGLGQPQLARFGLPFWIRSAQLTPWAEPLFAFSFSRQDFVDGPAMSTPGGTFSIGQLDGTAYQGAIEYTNLPASFESGWFIPLVQIGVGGQMFNISNGGYPSLAVIDTWRSEIGGPAAIVREIYAQVPGARRGELSDSNYWYYPCSAKVLLSFNFGGQTWPINPTDFALASNDPGTCVGALFEITSPTPTAPQWAIGLPFLKNVYSIFRYNPPSIGFAAKPGTTITTPSPTSTVVVSVAIAGNGTGTPGPLLSSVGPAPIGTTSAGESGPTTGSAALGGGSMSNIGTMNEWMLLGSLLIVGLALAQ